MLSSVQRPNPSAPQLFEIDRQVSDAAAQQAGNEMLRIAGQAEATGHDGHAVETMPESACIGAIGIFLRFAISCPIFPIIEQIAQ